MSNSPFTGLVLVLSSFVAAGVTRLGSAVPGRRMRRALFAVVAAVVTVASMTLMPTASADTSPTPETVTSTAPASPGPSTSPDSPAPDTGSPTPTPSDTPSEPAPSPSESATPSESQSTTATPSDSPPESSPAAPSTSAGKQPPAGRSAPQAPAPSVQAVLAAIPSSIPSNFLVVVDSGGANDQNAEQRDLTQMGRDDTSNPSVYDLFWSWDTTNFTAQKGNACALFDSDGDGLINFAVCAEVETTASGDPDVVKETARSPIAVTCNDTRGDRCGNPHHASVAGVLSGDLVGVDSTADLVTETDPFPDLDHDQTWPYDSTIRLQVPKSTLPAGAELANVCLYPSLGDDGNNAPSDCILRPANGLLKITKVAPDGTTQSFDFTVNPDGITRTITGSGSTAPIGLTIGSNYSVTESVPTGWTLTTASCTTQDGTATGTFSSANHNVTGISVQSGRLTTCTFTDAVQPSHLTLVKVVHNDHGGSEVATAWTLSASGPTDISGASGDAAVTNASVTAGVYSLSESGPAGYDASAWSCVGNAAPESGSSVTIGLGENVTCTISNSDRQPHLTLVKVVHNDNGGTAAASEWTLTADGPSTISGATGSGTVTNAAVPAGNYTLSESGGPSGYSASEWSCSGNDTALDGNVLTILPGEAVQCSITNTSQPASLALTKHVDNSNGGNATPTDWSLSATPQGILGQGTEGGAGGFAPRDVFAGTYLLGEAGPDGYTNGGWTCTGGSLDGSYLTIAPGATVSCDITNHSQKASLALTKTVDNGTTGAAHVPADWLLSAQGLEGLDTVSGSGGFGPTQVVAGDYDLAESGPSGYTTTGWVCTGNDVPLDGTVLTLKPGETVSCSIENVAQQPTLKLTKIVVNDNGGTAGATAWTLTATPESIPGQGVLHGAGGFAATPVKVGDYTLGESGPAGYLATDVSCSGGSLTGNVVSVDQGQTVECTITNDDQQSHLTLVKVVENDDGGTAATTAWTLSAVGPKTISGATGSPAVTDAAVDAGSYTLSESGGPAGYDPSAWSCTSGLSGSTVTLGVGQSVTCTITNSDQQPHLTLVKVVHNDHGGTAPATAWTLTADGPTPISGASGDTVVTDAPVNAGSYELSESGGPAGYDAGSWSCTSGLSGSTVTIALGQSVTCTIHNSDQQPLLTLVKVVSNTHGGTAVATDWTLSAVGPKTITGATGSATVTNAAVDAGSYALSESGPAGYDAAAWSCTSGLSGSSVTVGLGESVVCTVTNSDQQPHLTLVKTVSNTHGGTAPASAWTLYASGPTPISGVTGSGTVTDAAVNTGVYTLSESAWPSGYDASAWSCVAGGVPRATGSGPGGSVTVPVGLGESVTCTITNSDQQPHLTLVKIVENDDGGTAPASAWTLSADGPTPISGVTGSAEVTSAGVTAGLYTLGESGPAGYDASAWSCAIGTAPVATGTGPGGVTTVPVDLGESVVCTITNDDQQPHLTLVKVVENDDGGTAVATAWTLSASGPTPISGTTGATSVTAAEVNSGSYTLSESGPGGYDASAWSCVGNAVAESATSVTVGLGESVTCTITNRDQQPHLTLVKDVSNAHGGTAAASAWTLSADGPSPILGATGTAAVTNAEVNAGVYTLGESGPGGYDASAWVCTGNAAPVSGTLLLVGLGESVTCTITNSDQQPHLTLVKVVENDDGGAAVAADWTLSASGPSGISGKTGTAAVTVAPVTAGTYALSESGPAGYDGSAWVCVGNAVEESSTSVTVGLGESVTCTITNSDQQPHLTLVKVVDNTHGGDAVPTDWTLSAAGPTPISGASGGGAVTNAEVNAGVYTLSESGPGGYDASMWACLAGTTPRATGTGPAGATTVAVGLGESVSCTITNSDLQPYLTLVKVVENTHGGSATPADWTLSASGPTPISGVSGDGAVTTAAVDAGLYSLAESGPGGYDASAWSCAIGTAPVATGTGPGGITTVPVDLGQSVVCTITNRDQQPHLTLIKVVENDHGGTAVAADWMLGASGPTSFAGWAGTALVTNVPVRAGIYGLGESGPAGYDAAGWTCEGNAVPLSGSVLTVGLGESITCTVTNRDQQPHLTLVKTVSNTHGGTAAATAWTLSAGGPTPISGATGDDTVSGAAVNAGVYTLGESGPGGYDASVWVCTGNAAPVSGTLLLVGLGESVTCTVTNSDQQPHLTLVKTVSNTHGGSAVVADWTLSASGPSGISGKTGAAAVTNAAVTAGEYTLSESGPAGYDASTWDCTGNAVAESAASVTVGLGESVTCTITNSDQQPHLTLVKTVSNTHGGTAAATDWTLGASGPTPISGATGDDAVTDAAVSAGTYALGESGPGGYDASAWSCTGNAVPESAASVTVGLGESVTCTITNSDQQPHLTLAKAVSNTHGGTAAATDWTLSASGPTPISGTTGTGAVTGAPVSAGLYTLSESGPAGYDASAWTCTLGTLPVETGTGPGGVTTVPVELGQSVTCTITNSDQQPHLTLVKAVSNTHGGTAVATDWTLSAAGPTPISGASGDDAVSNAPVNAGAYTLSESGPAGYDASAWVCTGSEMGIDGTSVVIALGESVTCTVTNSDQQPHLTLVKTVSNTHGGTAAATDWALSADGPTPISGATGDDAVSNAPVNAGVYTLTESGPGGYDASQWTCTGAEALMEGASVTVGLGESVTCTITNSDQQPYLTLVKAVEHPHGGTATVDAWTLSADGPTPISGKTGDDAVTHAAVNAGTYTLGESGPPGYDASQWTCTGNEIGEEGSSVTILLGESVTCTVTNSDQQPLLTLKKAVSNTHGGSATAGAWTLKAQGPSTISGVTGTAAVTDAPVEAGLYALSESGPGGYAASAWVCLKGDQVVQTGTGTDGATLVPVDVGESITCTVTNSDLPGVLTLMKKVDNGLTGASAVPANWTLTATPDAIEGQAAVTGNGDPLSAGGVNGVAVFAGTYTLSESGGPAGYTAGAWACDGGVLDAATAKLTVANGADVTCAITNTAVAALLTLVKTVDNTAGGTAAATDFTLTAANGATVVSGATGAAAVTSVPVPVGTYALSESGPSGYTASAWACTGGSLAGSNLTLALGEVVTCSITNTAVSAGVAGVTTTRPHPSGGVAGVLATTGAVVLRYSWWAFTAILFGLVLTIAARRRHRA